MRKLKFEIIHKCIMFIWFICIHRILSLTTEIRSISSSLDILSLKSAANMVTLTKDFIKKNRKNSKNAKKSHLYLYDKHIDKIDDIATERNLSVLYLHNNLLKNVDNLSALKNLTHLYLQWNNIHCISNLNNLPQLSNLYLGYNRIQIVKGLKDMANLRILHLQYQKPSTNKINFSFDSETILALTTSLFELNVSGNNITSTVELQPLSELVNLNVSHNLITNLNDICETITRLEKLKKLEVADNPLARNKKYEWEITAVSFNLEIINDKTIPKMSRMFLQTFKAIKSRRENRKRKEKRTEFSSETKSFVHQLPIEFREIVSKSVIYSRNNRYD